MEHEEQQPLRECIEFRVRHEQAHADRDHIIDDHIKEATKDGGHRDQLRGLVESRDRFLRAIAPVSVLLIFFIIALSTVCGIVGGISAKLAWRYGIDLVSVIEGMGKRD